MTVSGFLTKTFDIFSDPANHDICCWGENGDSIHVKKIDLFSKTILPKYFKHSNFQSFVRQLNMYDFHKTVQDPGNGEFSHVNFRKNRPDLLPLIKRKAHNKHELRAKQQQQQERLNAVAGELNSKGMLDDSTLKKLSSSGATSSSVVQNPDSIYMMAALEQEQTKQKRIREDFEWRLSQLEAQKARIYELEAQQGRLSGENHMLKQMLEESRNQQNQLQNKMEGVLKLMYHAFVNSGNGNAPTIGNGIPESRLLEFCNFLNVPSPPLLKIEAGSSRSSVGNVTSNTNDNVVTALEDGDLMVNDDDFGFLENGDMSNDFMASPSQKLEGGKTESLKRRRGQHNSSSTTNNSSSDGARKILPHASIESSGQVDEKEGTPKFQKVVSFDSLAEKIVPDPSKPPLNGGGGIRNVGGNGIATEGAVLSRQHSLELPPPGQSISGGYYYTPLSSAHSVKKLKTENENGGDSSTGKGIDRQESVESLGIPLGHIDSMDSTLATLFDISDDQNLD